MCAHCGTPLVLEESELPQAAGTAPAGNIGADLPRPKRAAGPAPAAAPVPPLDLGVPSTNFESLSTQTLQDPDEAFRMALGGPDSAAAGQEFPQWDAPPAQPPRDTVAEQPAIQLASPRTAAPPTPEDVPVISRRKVYKESREVPMAPAEKAAPRPALKLEITGGLSTSEDPATAAAQPLSVEAGPLMTEEPRSASAAPRAPRTAYRQPVRSRRKTAFIYGSVLLGVVGLAVAALIIPSMIGDGDPMKVLEPLKKELVADSYPAYLNGAERLLAGAGKRSVRLKSAAAKLLASSAFIHGGDAARLDRAEKIVRSLSPGNHPPIDYQLARGYIALGRGEIKGFPKWPEAMLENPEVLVFEGWRLIFEGKPLQGWRSFQTALDREALLLGTGQTLPGFSVQVVAKYGIARGREMGRQRDAKSRHERVLRVARNHPGAQLGVLRRSNLPPQEAIKALNEFVEKHAADTAPGEIAEAYAILGRALRAEGRTAESDTALNRASTLAPTGLWATIAVAEVLVFDGLGQEALNRLRALGPNGTKTMDAKLVACGAELLRGETTNSLKLLQLAAVEQARDLRVLYWQGRHAEQAGDIEGAKDYYRRSAEYDYTFLPPSLQLASILVRQGRSEEALDTLKLAEAADRSHSSLQLALGQTLLANRYFAQARDAFNTALQSNPDLMAARLGIVSTYEKAREFQAAYDSLQALLTEKPDAPGAREKLGDALYNLGRKDEALAVYQKLMTAGKVANSVKVGAARIFLDRKDAAAARPLVEAVFKRDATEPGAAIGMSRVLWQEGQVSLALSEFNNAMRVDDSPEAHWHYALALRDAGRDDEALLQFGEACEIYPDALAERGRILLKRGQLDLALADLEKAVKQPGITADAWLLLGNAYEKMGQREKAVTAWRSGLKVSDDLPEAYYRLGRVEMESDRTASALEDLRRAASNAPEKAAWLADAFFQLGYAERAKGSRSAAAKAFERFLELAPKNAPTRSEVQRILAELK